jgi:hypothetical protein
MFGTVFVVTLVALFASFIFNWIGSVLPIGFLSEIFGAFGVFFVPMISYGIGYFSATKSKIQNLISSPFANTATLCVAASLLCYFAWYYFSYLNFLPIAYRILGQYYADPLVALDEIIRQSTGLTGFFGYYFWSASTGATISIADNDFNIASGGFALLVNWAGRIVAFIVAILWARRGFYEGLMERAKEGKATGEGWANAFESLTDSDFTISRR